MQDNKMLHEAHIKEDPVQMQKIFFDSYGNFLGEATRQGVENQSINPRRSRTHKIYDISNEVC